MTTPSVPGTPQTPPAPGASAGSGSSARSAGPAAPASPLRRAAALALAVLLPLVAVAALLGVAVPPPEAARERAPRESALTRASLVCPGVEAATEVGTASDARGRVRLRAGSAARAVPVRPHRLSSSLLGAGRGRAVVVTGLDDLAPGLVAGRFPRGGGAGAPACTAPVPETWFTGLGAGAEHASVVEVTNPDEGTAVLDLAIHGERGVVEVPALRGLAVPGRRTVRLDLASIVPRSEVLTAHLTTSRGRVAASVRDRVGLVGGGPRAAQWLPPQVEPATSSLLLGLAPGRGRRTLVLTNPGEDQTRASLRLVTRRSTFAPRGIEDVVVPAGSTVAVSLDDLLDPAALRTAVGLQVESAAPLTAGLRTLAGGDLSLLAASADLGAQPTAAVLPAGAKQVVLAGATGAGSARLTARTARGRRLAVRRADLGAGRASVVRLPPATRLLEVDLRGTGAAASVLVGAGGGRGGVAVVALRALQRRGLVADVRPARR